MSAKKLTAGLIIGVLLSMNSFAGRRDYQYPVLTATKGRAPKIDGIVDEKEWGDASSYEGFMKTYSLGEEWKQYPLHYLPQVNNRIWIKWDNEKLYVAFRYQRVRGVAMVANAPNEKGKDARVFADDAVEIFLVTADRKNHFVFAGNSVGASLDAANHKDSFENHDSAWNGDWEYKVDVKDDYWSGEIAVSFKSLKTSTPTLDKPWKIGVGRYQPGFIRSTISPMGGWYFESPYYANLLFSEDWKINSSYPKVKLRAVAKTIVTNVSDKNQKLDFEGGIFNMKNQETGKVHIKFPDVAKGFAYENISFSYSPEEGEKTDIDLSLPSGKSKTFLAMLPGTNKEKFLAEQKFSSDSRTFFYQVLPILYSDSDSSMIVKFKKRFLTKEKVDVIVKAYSLKPNTTTIKGQLIDKKKNPVAEEVLEKSANGDFIWSIDTKNLAPGQYKVKLTADDVIKNVKLNIPKLPVWHVNKVGVSNEIPPPYKPISISANTLSFTFGQKYTFSDDNLFPTQIKTVYGVEILEAPITLNIQSGGKELKFKWNDIKQQKLENHMVLRTGTLKADGLTMSAELKIDFDGLAWAKINLDSKIPISELSLVVPLKNKYARLYKMMRPDIHKGSLVERGRVPQEGVQSDFMPEVWLGDVETGGFEWSCESFKDWANKNPEKRIEIKSEKSETILKINFISKTVSGTSVKQYAFGMMATPVRDWRKKLLRGNFSEVYTFPMDEKGLSQITLKKPNGKTKDYWLKKTIPTAERKDLNFWFYGRKAPKWFSKGSVVVYPLLGNIHGDEGSISVKVKTCVEKSSKTMDIFYLDLGVAKGILVKWLSPDAEWKKDKAKLEISWFDNKKIVRKTDFLNLDPQKYHDLCLQWKKGDKGTNFSLVIDGKKLLEDNVPMDMTAINWKDKKLFLGGNTQMMFDELKITGKNSKILLKDNFSEEFEPNDYLQTKAEVISGMSAETGGWVDQWGEFVGSGENKAIKLSAYAQKDPLVLTRASGVKTLHSHYWHRGVFGPYRLPSSKKRADLAKKFIKLGHDKGFKMQVYYLKNISPDDPYWDDFGEEMTLKPMRPTINNYVLAPESGSGADFLVWSIKDMIEKYNIDGTHMDYGNMMASQSLEYNSSAWKDENGRVHKGYPILEQRAMNRRIYNLYHLSPKKDGIHKNHISMGVLFASGEGTFIDFGISGELEEGTPKDGTVGEWMPADKYLSFYSTKISGIPTVIKNEIGLWALLSFDGVPQSHLHTIRRYPLMKGGQFNPYRKGGHLDLRSTAHLLFPIMTDFSDGEQIGFWKSAPYVKVVPDNKYNGQFVKVSLIKDKKEKRCLVIVGNLGPENQKISLNFDYGKLGFDPNKVAIRDAYTREVYKSQKPEFTVNSENFRMLIIKERNSERN